MRCCMSTLHTRYGVIVSTTLVLWFSISVVTVAHRQAEKAVQWFVYQNPAPLPATTEELFDATHSIVRVTVERARVEVLPARQGEPYPTVHTIYDLKIGEQLKKHAS